MPQTYLPCSKAHIPLSKRVRVDDLEDLLKTGHLSLESKSNVDQPISLPLPISPCTTYLIDCGRTRAALLAQGGQNVSHGRAVQHKLRKARRTQQRLCPNNVQ